MVNEKRIKYLEKIKQLEEENRLLKHRILSNMLSDNTEITRLNFKIDELEKSVEFWKQKVYLFRVKEKLKFNWNILLNNFIVKNKVFYMHLVFYIILIELYSLITLFL